MNKRDTLVNDVSAISFLEKNFEQEIALINELREYGLDLFLRIVSTIESNKKNFHIDDFVIVHILYKNFLSLLDGISILIPLGSTLSSFPMVRSLFETSLYIEWIIKEDSLHRAKCFYVWNLRDRILKVKRIIKGTEENNELISNFGEDPFKKYDQNKARSDVDELEKKLNSTEYKRINDLFSDIKAKKRNKLEPNWYTPANTTKTYNIWKIANDVSRTSEYKYIYSEQCSISHANKMDYHVEEIPNQIVIEPIRQPQLAPEIISTTMQLCFHTYGTVISKYRCDELEAYRKKYIKQWRIVFLNIPPVITHTEHVPIRID